jgi:hypothetical protein
MSENPDIRRSPDSPDHVQALEEARLAHDAYTRHVRSGLDPFRKAERERVSLEIRKQRRSGSAGSGEEVSADGRGPDDPLGDLPGPPWESVERRFRSRSITFLSSCMLLGIWACLHLHQFVLRVQPGLGPLAFVIVLLAATLLTWMTWLSASAQQRLIESQLQPLEVPCIQLILDAHLMQAHEVAVLEHLSARDRDVLTAGAKGAADLRRGSLPRPLLVRQARTNLVFLSVLLVLVLGMDLLLGSSQRPDDLLMRAMVTAIPCVSLAFLGWQGWDFLLGTPRIPVIESGYRIREQEWIARKLQIEDEQARDEILRKKLQGLVGRTDDPAVIEANARLRFEERRLQLLQGLRQAAEQYERLRGFEPHEVGAMHRHMTGHRRGRVFEQFGRFVAILLASYYGGISLSRAFGLPIVYVARAPMGTIGWLLVFAFVFGAERMLSDALIVIHRQVNGKRILETGYPVERRSRGLTYVVHDRAEYFKALFSQPWHLIFGTLIFIVDFALNVSYLLQLGTVDGVHAFVLPVVFTLLFAGALLNHVSSERAQNTLIDALETRVPGRRSSRTAGRRRSITDIFRNSGSSDRDRENDLLADLKKEPGPGVGPEKTRS